MGVRRFSRELNPVKAESFFLDMVVSSTVDGAAVDKSTGLKKAARRAAETGTLSDMFGLLSAK